jgi:hypothetical protein
VIHLEATIRSEDVMHGIERAGGVIRFQGMAVDEASWTIR